VIPDSLPEIPAKLAESSLIILDAVAALGRQSGPHVVWITQNGELRAITANRKTEL
jgi:hypothetical protein